MTTLADSILDATALGKIVAVALAGSITVALAYAVTVVAAAQTVERRHTERAWVPAAALAGLGLAVCVGAAAIGVYAMTQK